MVKAIFFDFWGTLIENGIHPSPARQVKYFLRLDIPFSDFIVKFEDVFMTKKFDDLNQAFHEVSEAFDKRVPDFVYEKLVGMWNKFSILSKPFPETIAVLEKLKKKHKLVVLSNSDHASINQVL